MTTYKLTIAAVKMFVRNRQALFFTLFMPTVIMTIFGLIGFDRPPRITIGIVADSSSARTGVFIEAIKSVSVFDVKQGTEADERAAIGNGDRSLVLIVPQNLFPESLGPAMETGKLVVLTNAGEQQQANAALTIINEVVDGFERQLTHAPHLIEVQPQEINSRNLKYIDFLLPGLIALSIMQMAVFSVAFVFVDYKEKGILKRLLATPMRPYQFVTANVITRLAVALVQATILMAIGVLAFHAHVVGSYSLIFLIAFLGAVMFLGLGFTISGIASTVETVPALANLIVFPMLFLGGSFFPISAMPDWLQKIVVYLPLQYFSHAMREVMTKGVSLGAIASDLYWMTGWAVILITLATVTFGFEEKRQG